MAMTNITKQYVFLVDDEQKVRKVVGRTLEQAGFKEVAVAKNDRRIVRFVVDQGK